MLRMAEDMGVSGEPSVSEPIDRIGVAGSATRCSPVRCVCVGVLRCARSNFRHKKTQTKYQQKTCGCLAGCVDASLSSSSSYSTSSSSCDG